VLLNVLTFCFPARCAVCMLFVDSVCDLMFFLGMYVVVNLPVISSCHCTTLFTKLDSRDSAAAIFTVCPHCSQCRVL